MEQTKTTSRPSVDLNDKQRGILDKFKEKLADVLQPEHDDPYLLRWLKARNFDLVQSEKMLRNHLKWRKVVHADEIRTNWKPPPVLTTYFPGGFHGFDKAGRPIWIEPQGKTDCKGILLSVKKSDVLKYKIMHCEITEKLLHEQSVKMGRKVGVVIIFDLEDFSMKHLSKPALDCYGEILTMYEANYPETLDVAYVINAPAIFPLAFSLVKPFLSADTKQKIKILGSNWKQELLKVIDADQLPVHWGGTATDPDGNPFCRSKVVCGGKVDPKYYIRDYSFVDPDACVKRTVSRRASVKVPFQVLTPGSSVRWQFITENGDIGFGIYYETEAKNGKTEAEIVLPIMRLNSHMVPEDGVITCHKPGVYVVTFDNSYSWITSKKLLYQIDILPPADSTDELPATC